MIHIAAAAPRALEIAMMELGDSTPSIIAMGHAVEALLILYPDLRPETGLWWVGAKSLTFDAFGIAMRMSGAAWDHGLAQRIVGAIRHNEPVLPNPVKAAPEHVEVPVAQVASVVRRRGQITSRSRVIDRRVSGSVHLGEPAPGRFDHSRPSDTQSVHEEERALRMLARDMDRMIARQMEARP